MHFYDTTDYEKRLSAFIHELEQIVDDDGRDFGRFSSALRDRAFDLAREGEELLNRQALEEADVESDRASWGNVSFNPDEDDDDDEDVVDHDGERLEGLGLPALEKSEFPTTAADTIAVLEEILDALELNKESAEGEE